jgi:hypothetical protein
MVKSLISIYKTEKHNPRHEPNKKVESLIEYNNLSDTRPVVSLYNGYYSLKERLEQIYHAIKTDNGINPENLNMTDNSFTDLSSLLLCIATIDKNIKSINRDNVNFFTNNIDDDFYYDYVIKLYKEEVVLVVAGEVTFIGTYHEFMNFIIKF